MEQEIVITKKDYVRLNNLFNITSEALIEKLEVELDRAEIIYDTEVSPDVVTMNSTVEYMDMKLNKNSTITIVYPVDADLKNNKISVLAPIGSALIGLKENQEISWEFPNGTTKSLKVVKVHYQPEAAGDWDL